MSVAAEALPTIHPHRHEHELASEHNLGVRNLAALALRAAKVRLEGLSAARSQAYAHESALIDSSQLEAAAITTPLIDTLSESKLMDQHGNLSAHRQDTDGHSVTLAYHETPAYDSKGKPVITNPNFGAWHLSLGQGKKTEDYELRLGTPGSQNSLAINRMNKRRIRKGSHLSTYWERKPLETADGYAAIATALKFLHEGMPTKQTAVSADQTSRRKYSLGSKDILHRRQDYIKSLRSHKPPRSRTGSRELALSA